MEGPCRSHGSRCRLPRRYSRSIYRQAREPAVPSGHPGGPASGARAPGGPASSGRDVSTPPRVRYTRGSCQQFQDSLAVHKSSTGSHTFSPVIPLSSTALPTASSTGGAARMSTGNDRREWRWVPGLAGAAGVLGGILRRRGVPDGPGSWTAGILARGERFRRLSRPSIRVMPGSSRAGVQGGRPGRASRASSRASSRAGAHSRRRPRRAADCAARISAGLGSDWRTGSGGGHPRLCRGRPGPGPSRSGDPRPGSAG
jgi:hypothetical protein